MPKLVQYDNMIINNPNRYCVCKKKFTSSIIGHRVANKCKLDRYKCGHPNCTFIARYKSWVYNHIRRNHL